MTNTMKMKSAIEILKEKGISGIGKVRTYVSEANSNEVDIMSEAGRYCTVNIKSRSIKNL